MSGEEGPNDGLVSVASSKWGDYKGTLVNVSHLDLINWTNRLRWLVWEMTGNKRKYASHVMIMPYWRLTFNSFNAIAFYLDIGGKDPADRSWIEYELTGCRHASQGGTLNSRYVTLVIPKSCEIMAASN